MIAGVVLLAYVSLGHQRIQRVVRPSIVEPIEMIGASIVHMTGATKLSEMGGLARRYPLLAAAFAVGVMSISGVPPFNGYVSLGLIHDALRASHQFVPFALMLLAQVVTMAALGRAAWQAFFARPAAGETAHEHLRVGMVVSLVILALGCLGFGIFPTAVLAHIASPAAAALLHPASYAHAVLASGGSITATTVHFDYWGPGDILIVAATTILAVPFALLGRRYRAPIFMIARKIQNGSVNDYAGFLVSGMVVAVIVLAR